MKRTQAITFGAVIFLLATGVLDLSAARWHHFNFHMSGTTTNEVGAIEKVSIGTRRVLREISMFQSVPVEKLALVYDRDTGQVMAVGKEFGDVVAVVFTMESNLQFNTQNLSQTAFYARITNPQGTFDGSAVGSIAIRRNAAGVETRFRMSGKIHIGVYGTSYASEIHSGVFSIVTAFVPESSTR
jgi:hypothetical protein